MRRRDKRDRGKYRDEHKQRQRYQYREKDRDRQRDMAGWEGSKRKRDCVRSCAA